MVRRIGKATPRKTPRPFSFHWGSGNVVEEISVRCTVDGHGWEPAIQLLEYEDGTQQLRFCVYDRKRFSRMPLIMGPDEIAALSKQVRRSRRIKKLLGKLAK